MIKLERFSGHKPATWVLQAEKYFAFYNILSEHKLPLASLYFDGDALNWYRWLFQNKQLGGWDHFVDKLFIRFRKQAIEERMMDMADSSQVLNPYVRYDTSLPSTTYLGPFTHGSFSYQHAPKSHDNNSGNGTKHKIADDNMFDESPERNSLIELSHVAVPKSSMAPLHKLGVSGEIVLLDSDLDTMDARADNTHLYFTSSGNEMLDCKQDLEADDLVKENSAVGESVLVKENDVAGTEANLTSVVSCSEGSLKSDEHELDSKLSTKMIDAMYDTALFATSHGPSRTIASMPHTFGLQSYTWVATMQGLKHEWITLEYDTTNHSNEESETFSTNGITVFDRGKDFAKNFPLISPSYIRYIDLELIPFDPVLITWIGALRVLKKNIVKGKDTLHATKCVAITVKYTTELKVGSFLEYIGLHKEITQKMKGSMIMLDQWLSRHKTLKFTFQKSYKLFVTLRARYEHVSTNWTVEQCTKCQWVDWDYNTKFYNDDVLVAGSIIPMCGLDWIHNFLAENDVPIIIVVIMAISYISSQVIPKRVLLNLCAAAGRVTDILRHLEVSYFITNQVESCLKRLEGATSSTEVPANFYQGALRCTELSTQLRAYYMLFANVENNFAQVMFCWIVGPQAALDHSTAVIQILEELYDRQIFVYSDISRKSKVAATYNFSQADSWREDVFHDKLTARIFMLLYSNLEDKVLIEDGNIVMNLVGGSVNVKFGY